MPQQLNMLNRSVEGRLLKKGSRVFALLGKATSSGITAFGPGDLQNGWAVTAEFGCVRLERLSGDEEVTGLEVYLPTPFSYDYGLAGISGTAEVGRIIFGLLPAELEELVTTLRQGSFPILGYSPAPLKCGLTHCVIPARWPHVVVSNLGLYGNVVSVETFMRLMISSMPQGRLTARYPRLTHVFKEMLRLIVVQRRGAPYSTDLLEMVD